MPTDSIPELHFLCECISASPREIREFPWMFLSLLSLISAPFPIDSTTRLLGTNCLCPLHLLPFSDHYLFPELKLPCFTLHSLPP